MGRTRAAAILLAYRTVQRPSWPELNPDLDERARRWPDLDEALLQVELRRLVAETERPGQNVRVFWKIGNDLTYEGCNRQFANDAGFKEARELIGLTDFDPRIAWILQSAKYRKDDFEVMETRKPKLRIIERQHSAAGTIWLHTGKAPILLRGEAIGIMGMYEVIDLATATRMSRSE